MSWSYDNMGALGEYFAEFTTAGDTPTSLYGFGTLQPSTRLPSQPAGTAKVTATTVKVTALQNYLNALDANVTKTGIYDAQTEAAWKRYVSVFKEPHSELAPVIVDQLEDRKTVHISKEALGRLSSRAKGDTLPADKRAAQMAKLRAEASRPIGSRPSGAPTTSKAPSKNVTASTTELQKILINLKVDPKNITDGKFGPTTKAKWQAEVKKHGLDPTITGKTGAKQVTVNRLTLAKMRSLSAGTAPAAPVAAKDMVANTSDVQSILKRLGFKDTSGKDRLGDGLFGSFTASTWGQAAAKRTLDPFIAKKDAKGTTVTVRERTYLMLKADADAKVAPAAPEPIGGSLRDMYQKGTAVIATAEEMKLLLSRLGSKDADLAKAYGSIAKSQGLDPRVETVPQGFLVVKASLTALLKLVGEMAPPKPPPGPQLTELEKQVAAIVKGSTGSIPVNTVRVAINAAIQDKRITASPVPTTGAWEGSLRPLLMATLQVSGPLTAAWENALVPGKLVSKDGKTLKLPPPAVDFLTKAAAALKKVVAQVEDFKGFTEVNPAQVIAKINSLNVSSVKFDRAGDEKVLADAIRTFLENTKRKVPAGALVRLNVAKTKVYVKDSVISDLATAVSEAEKRLAVTQSFRKNMVDNALRAMTATVPITKLQTAIVETVAAGKAGKNAKLFGAVKVTGSFDAPTRAAYTELARTLTIGPAVQQYQALLKERLGPNFKTALVTEARNQVWGEVLDKSVSVTKCAKPPCPPGTLKMLPAIANQVEAAAKVVESRMTAEAARKKEAAEVLAAENKLLADAVKKSTAIVSILDLQMSLLQMVKDKEIDAVPGLAPSGRATAATKEALFGMSGLIFPEGSRVSEILWGRYLNEVGIIVVSATQVKKGWSTSNYIALPPSVADLVSKRGGEWVAANGLPPAAGDLLPLPLKNEQLLVRFKKPSVISVKRPPPKEVVITEKEAAAKTVEAAKPAAKTTDEEQEAARRAEAERAAAERAAAEKAAAEKRASEQRAAAEAAAAAEAEKKAAADRAAAEAAAAREAEARAAEAAAREAAARAAAAEQQAAQLRDQQAMAAAEAARQEALRRAQEAEERARIAEEAAAAAQAQAAAPAQSTATTAGGAQVTGPSITGPTIQITTGQPQQQPQVQQAGMFGGGIAGPLLLVAGAAAVAYTVATQQREGSDEERT